MTFRWFIGYDGSFARIAASPQFFGRGHHIAALILGRLMTPEAIGLQDWPDVSVEADRFVGRLRRIGQQLKTKQGDQRQYEYANANTKQSTARHHFFLR